ncbi:MAG: hypothetical protein U1E04_16500 [Hylemonella sp.]|nr:hypothetical protein [Hylemonella sp.]
MKKILSKPFESIAFLGLFFFLFLSTIDGILTTSESLDYILLIRHVSWAGLFSCVFVLILFARRSFDDVWECSAPLLVLLVWAGAATYIYSRHFYEPSDFVYVLIASIQGVMGACLLGMSRTSMLSDVLRRFFNVYGVLAFLLILISDGLSFEYPAKFNFAELSDMFGGQVLYSQGMSRLFGIVAIFFALGLASSAKGYQYLIYGFLLLGSLVLCLLGGARGESFFAIFLVICICFWRYRTRFLIFSMATALGLHLAVTDWNWLNDFVVFQRYSVLGGEADAASGRGGEADAASGRGGEYGYRDVLLRQSWGLLVDNPDCLIWGCGLGYFQKYYNYSFGMYPHNEVVELVITHGMFLTLFVVMCVSIGFWSFVKDEPRPAPLALLYIYSLLLALKGGTVFSSGLFIALSLYFFVRTWRLMVHWWR